MLSSTAATNDLTQVRVLRREGSVAACSGALSLLLAQQPDQFDALCLLGQLLVQSEHFGECVLLLRRAFHLARLCGIDKSVSGART